MTEPTYDQAFWEALWSRTIREHPDRVAGRPPNAYLTQLASDLVPGRALDAGCGHGAETLWLASLGWRVTAVDFSQAALEHGRSTAATAGLELAARIDWLQADLGDWTPQPASHDLVLSLYVHIAGSVEAMATRMASAVAPGGSLLLVGHRPTDPASGEATPATGQTQMSVAAALAVRDEAQWEIFVAEERPRAVNGSGVDAVICARRRA